MKSLFLAPLLNLRVTGRLGRGLILNRGYFLTNDRGLVKELLSEEFRSLAGDIATREILAAEAVFHAEMEFDFSQPPNMALTESHITSLLELGQQFLMTLWLLKDNAIVCGDGYLQYPFNSGATGVYGCRHSLSRYYWDSRAERKVAEFSPDELREGRTIFAEIANRLGLKKGVEAEPTIPGDVSRLGRAWWILETARMTADVALKIAHYVTCFEGLFSTDSSELVHKLSERIAWFLGATPQERLSLFRTVKEAYAVRSKVVHGDKLSNKQFAGLRNVSDTCDDLLRRSLRKIMESSELRARFNGNPQELETFLLELVMGGTEGPVSV